MLDRIRQALESTAGKIAAGVLVLVALVAIYISFQSNLGDSTAAQIAANRVFIDATTGKSFTHEMSIGEKVPVKAPSGGNTGYLGEACFWTADGKTKKQPTWVLLNRYVGKPEPTFCPDCGRLVVGLNPAPVPGEKAPPTAAEHAARPPRVEQ
jgi:hypothetical protein